MNSKKIEDHAADIVSRSINLSDILQAFISKNDKEPSWDGHVYVYKNEKLLKADLIGRVPVQVKGKVESDFSRSAISYSMKVSDLKNYLAEGGTVFFVVYLDTNGETGKIYYVFLSAIKLRHILKNCISKKKGVQLQEFPNNKNEKANIFIDALNDCKKQKSFADKPLYSLEELQTTGLLKAIEFSLATYGGCDIYSELFKRDISFYANIKNSPIPQPLADVYSIQSVSRVRNVRIVADSIEYYNQCRIEKQRDADKVEIGSSLSLIHYTGNDELTVHYENAKLLRSRTHDLAFLLATIRSGGFEFGGQHIPLIFDDTALERFDIESNSAYLCKLQKAVKVLDDLGYTEDIEIEKLSVTENRNFERLITAFIDNEPVSGLKPDLPPVSKIKIGNAVFLLFFKQLGNSGTYKIEDYFQSDVGVYVGGLGDEKLNTSKYAILKGSDILEISNIRFEEILDSFKALEYSTAKFPKATLFMLELIKAYDLSGDTREDILLLAHKFAEWIISESPDDNAELTDKLNLLQIIKREQGLSTTEKTELYSLVESASVDEDIKTGACLLLDDQIGANVHFSRMSSDKQDEFRTFPICRFWDIEYRSE